MKLIKNIHVTALVFMAIASQSTFAHSPLISSVPSNQATISEAPASVELSFKSEVKLILLRLSGDSIDLKLKAKAADPSKMFSLELPALPSGSYVAAWHALGRDGHLMKGKIHFAISP